MTQAEIYLMRSSHSPASTAEQLEESIFGYQALLDLLKEAIEEPKPHVDHDKKAKRITLTFEDGSTLKATDPFNVGPSSVTSLSPDGYTLAR